MAAMLRFPVTYHGLNIPPSQLLFLGLRLVGSVPLQLIRATAGAPNLSGDGGDGVHQLSRDTNLFEVGGHEPLRA